MSAELQPAAAVDSVVDYFLLPYLALQMFVVALQLKHSVPVSIKRKPIFLVKATYKYMYMNQNRLVAPTCKCKQTRKIISDNLLAFIFA